MAFFVLLCVPCCASDKDLSKDLKSRYAQKIFVLRNFYAGNHLQYDAGGKLVGDSRMDDWSGDGIVQIERIHVSRQSLKIRANRLVAFAQNAGQLSLLRSADGVDIEIEAGSEPITASRVAQLWSSIFLNQNDRFVELIPEFWRTCVQVALSQIDDKIYSGCHFSNDLAALLGAAAYSKEEAAKVLLRKVPVASFMQPDAQGRLKRVGGDGITPPRELSHQEPEFSECARRSHLQGTLTLMLIVDEAGVPQDIRVARPLGCDLDANAVAQVKQWKFKPAEKNGRPVPVEIGVEVDFRLQ